MKPTPACSDALATFRDVLEQRDRQPHGADFKFMAKCPAHQDRTPSLSVSEGPDPGGATD
jgi:hypothetical protein